MQIVKKCQQSSNYLISSCPLRDGLGQLYNELNYKTFFNQAKISTKQAYPNSDQFL